MLKRILKTAALTAAGLPAFLASVMLSTISRAFSEKINSAERLDEIIKEESEKLGINAHLYLKGNLSNKYAASVDFLKKSSLYTMNIGGFAAKRSVVKHELYHFKKEHHHGEVDENESIFFNYIFKEEPQAVLYSLGIKI